MNIINITSELIFRLIKPLLKLLHSKAGYSAEAFNRKLGDFEAPNFVNEQKIKMFMKNLDIMPIENEDDPE